MDIPQGATQEKSFHRQISVEDFHGSPYQDQVLALRKGPYLDFPATLSIETMSLCNAACDFCPYPGLDRKGETMPDQIIEKILNEIGEISDRPPFKITLARVNEPFLDTRLFDVSHDIERRFPEATSFFFSNGTPLTEKNLLRLAELQRVDYLNISVNDHRREKYERTMRLPFDNTLSRLDLVQRMKNSGALKFPVFLSRVGDGTPADAEYLEWVRMRYPSLNGLVTVRGNWLGKIHGDVARAPDVACRQWFELHILANGRTAFCCIDSEGSHGMGDARRHHVIHEVYNHPARRKLRSEVNSRREVDPCNTCPMLP
jgi:Radical SAM superfamily/Iron-sulfur cluster-binding domain